MLSRLEGIEAKLNRAEQQIGTLKDFSLAWTAREKPYRLRSQVDEGKRRYIWVFEVLKPIPPLPALIGDEIIHHLRSVLDHLAGYLVKANGIEPTQATKWPIEGSRWGWKRNVEGRRRDWPIWRKQRGGPLGGIPPGSPIWAFVESTQPYKRGGKTRDDPLFSLNENWNLNKHRVLNPFWFEADPQGDPLDFFDVSPDIKPVESKWIIRPGHKIQHEAKVALFRFPVELPLPAMKVKVGAQVPAQISMGDEKGAGVDIEETLELIRRIVARARVLAESVEGISTKKGHA